MSIQAVGAVGPAAAVQEATETTAVTKKEAASGDQQAVRKLARMQQAQQAAPGEEATESQAEKMAEAQKSAALQSVSTAGVGGKISLTA